MGSYQEVLDKLEGFSKKYYTKKLVQGALLFIALGFLFWLAITSVELFLWLDSSWRLTLFIIFVIVEGYLLYRFIIIPTSYLLRIKKGLTNKEASRLIGVHFPTVEDKLFNLLELAENPAKSELLQASIEQRSKTLRPLPFKDAIDFKDGYKYARYLIAPIAILTLFWLSGNIGSLLNSHDRVINYDLAYERPAPFLFKLLTTNLQVLDNEPLTIEFAIEGDIVPENASIVFGDKTLLMRRRGNSFIYVVEPPFISTEFYVEANGWKSRSYRIESINTPTLVDFKMNLKYPRYLNKSGESVDGSGNAVVPEGTRVEWVIRGTSVDEVRMSSYQDTALFDTDEERFILSKTLEKNWDYVISTSNENVKDFESLRYSIDVIKDASPKIEVNQIMDSLNPNQSFYMGQLSDDYGLSKLSLVYYRGDNEQNKKKVSLESLTGSVHQFYYTFPSGIDVEEGGMYKIYFEVIDNDGLRGGKVTRSKVFNTKVYNDNELINKELEVQDNLLRKFDESLKGYREQQETLSKINERQKEGGTFNFEEKTKIKDFIQKQKEQEQLMEKFSKQLNQSLDKNSENDELKRLLQERLRRQELEAKRNERLLDELNKLADKIEKEELKKRLEELSKKQGSNARNLEQLLELTKRYYVTEKASQLGRDLEKLANEQSELAKEATESKNKNSEDQIDEQKKLNESFDKISDELDELKEDNQKLKKPLSFKDTKKDEKSIRNDQEDALDELKKDESSSDQESQKNQNSAAKKQKSAAQKMEQLGKSLQQSAAAGGGSSDTEDAEMLRQILDNLVTFSFKQEQLFEWVEESDVDVSQYGKMVRDQKGLRGLFEHVDDSLFALSLRRAELSEFVNEQITDVYYNIDKSLESLAENQVFQGASYQQYVINATNSLGDFLANILDNMQQNMQPGQGQGQGGEGFQLPDIIQGQKGIQEKVNSSGQEGNKKKDKKGDSNEGLEGKDGESKESKDGEGKGKDLENGNAKGENQPGGEEMGFNEIYEIYKQQSFLRQQLEQQLDDIIKEADRELAEKLIRQMEDFENDLIENGITKRTQQKVNVIQHQLLKLENAALKQGEQKERESKTEYNKYVNPIITKPDQLIKTSNDIEILNRQALPLRRQYDKRVKEYFRND
ncbi:hypothetical protein [Flagellimonas sp.]|uniref:hypothetical protein n=1 Tax=Flagellimonas sp. TaxID=2058762 RepID=UPI003F4A7DBB